MSTTHEHVQQLISNATVCDIYTPEPSLKQRISKLYANVPLDEVTTLEGDVGLYSPAGEDSVGFEVESSKRVFGVLKRSEKKKAWILRTILPEEGTKIEGHILPRKTSVDFKIDKSKKAWIFRRRFFSTEALPTRDDLVSLRREAVLERAAPDQPRGTREAAAPLRSARPGVDIDRIRQTLLLSDDQDVQEAAVGVLGEYGSETHVKTLGEILLPRKARVRSAAAVALATIGGVEAERYLLLAIESDIPLKVREQALISLADLLARGWETYQMSDQRVEMPKDIRRRLEAIREPQALRSAITNVLRAFD